MSGWRILDHAISALTMVKIGNFSTKNENDALQLGTPHVSTVPNTT